NLVPGNLTGPPLDLAPVSGSHQRANDDHGFAVEQVSEALPGFNGGEQHWCRIAATAAHHQDSPIAGATGLRPGLSAVDALFEPAILGDIAAELDASPDRLRNVIFARRVEELAAAINDDLVVGRFHGLIHALRAPGCPHDLGLVHDVPQAQHHPGAGEFLAGHLKGEAQLTLHAERRVGNQEDVWAQAQ